MHQAAHPAPQQTAAACFHHGHLFPVPCPWARYPCRPASSHCRNCPQFDSCWGHLLDSNCTTNDRIRPGVMGCRLSTAKTPLTPAWQAASVCRSAMWPTGCSSGDLFVPIKNSATRASVALQKTRHRAPLTIKRNPVVLLHGLQRVGLPLEVDVRRPKAAAWPVIVHRGFL